MSVRRRGRKSGFWLVLAICLSFGWGNTLTRILVAFGWLIVLVLYVWGKYKISERTKTAADLYRPVVRKSKRVPADRFANAAQKRAIFRKYNGHCKRCGRPVIRTKRPVDNQANFDHIKPYSWGGKTELRNLQLLCRKCNMKKGARYEG